MSAGNSWVHSTMWREERFKAGVCHTGDWKVADCNSPGGKESWASKGAVRWGQKTLKPSLEVKPMAPVRVGLHNGPTDFPSAPHFRSPSIQAAAVARW